MKSCQPTENMLINVKRIDTEMVSINLLGIITSNLQAIGVHFDYCVANATLEFKITSLKTTN